MDFDERLKQLNQQIHTKKSLEAKRTELEAQRETLHKHATQLKKIMWTEQADVDKLTRTSMTSILSAMLGNKEKRLEKEQAEAFAAKMKYDSAVRQLQVVEADLHHLNSELRTIASCEQQYQELLEQKAQAIEQSGSETAKQLFALDEQITALQSQKKEIQEAISAGSRARNTINSILSSLNNAEDWGTLDLFGGGVLSDLAKHSHLDDAQEKVETLQEELRRFKTELADVTIQADLQIRVDGFLRFADYFFDSFFTDWAVMDKINQSQASVQKNKRPGRSRALSAEKYELFRRTADLFDALTKRCLGCLCCIINLAAVTYIPAGRFLLK